MQTTPNPSTALVQAVAFATDKQRALFGEQLASVVSVRQQPIDFPYVYSKTGILLGF
jgi:hypothetical protein